MMEEKMTEYRCHGYDDWTDQAIDRLDSSQVRKACFL